MDTIRIEHLNKSFTTTETGVVRGEPKQTRTRQVLKDLCVEFPINQLTAIVGRSGCGKSTLLKIMDKQDTADEGQIVMPEGWHTSMLSPNPYVVTWTNVTKNVALAAGAGRTPEERMELAEKLVKMVRLEEHAHLTPMELSTGMKQRLGLARVLASRSEVLLMDEPFASMDFITRGELQQEVLQIQAQMPRTIILVTHQLEEALLMAQKIVVMHSDSSIREFDLSGYAYPRDLMSEEMLRLREEVTEECKK